ncbi:ribonuclease P protein subunit POP4 [Geosmithia morbida]|uniref:Ribonuclease P protein subunit n=1 Tax=Geosmithia morbida TaxID=1094350 RepID=A0A9P4YYH7_9HYPO|nr:ribonuclease P protein subunit POP4 [Geosmithia morbida]KAF4125423.1 ribonuclease P protein subunit POP4 [Geosmithia morbida]
MASSTNLATHRQMTRDLLSRAHSPDSVERIYNEKILHRTLHLRPSSPPPGVISARTARRKRRQQERDRTRKQKPAPLSARERRRLGLDETARDGQRYATYEGLNKLWMGYMREILGTDVHVGGVNAAAKLASAEFHGAHVEVVRSRCPGRVGISGIVVRDGKYAMDIVTRKRGVKIVPKEGTVFRVAVAVGEDEKLPRQDKRQDGQQQEQEQQRGNDRQDKSFVFDILGDQMMLRSADRATRKFKGHFLKNL